MTSVRHIKRATAITGYDAILFDMGHTLAEFTGADARAEPLRELGYRGTGDELHVALDSVISESADAFAALTSLPTGTPVDADAYKAVWSDVYTRTLVSAGYDGDMQAGVDVMWHQWLYEAWRLYDEVPAVLDQLAATGRAIGIVSNWPPGLELTCAHLGLTRTCSVIVCSASVGYMKPDRRIFEIALETAGVRPDRTLYVGDNYENDVLGARSAGLDAIHLVRDADGARHDGERTIASLTELCVLLAGSASAAP